MDLEAARAALAGAVGAQVPPADAATQITAARAILGDYGAKALGVPPSPLENIIRLAAESPPNQARRDFAVLLVDALGARGLVPSRGETEHAIRSFLENALLNPLRRAGYPFDGTTYDKRLALAGLHATIDEHLRMPEPSIPRWLHGVGPMNET